MKKTLIILSLITFHFVGFSQSPLPNYVQVTTPHQSVTDLNGVDQLSSNQKSVSRSYSDGLGRTIQNVVFSGDQPGKDIVQPVEYDNLGRALKSYLPYSTSSNSDNFYPDAINEQLSFYSNSSNLSNGLPQSAMPYALSLTNNSPFDQLIEAGSPGSDWQPGSGHTNRVAQAFNSANEVYNWEVLIDNATGFPTGARLNSNQNYFSANELMKIIKTDENGKISISYSDKGGKSISIRSQVQSSVANSIFKTEDYANGSNQAPPTTVTNHYFDTYYLYDEFGRLVFIIPSQAIEKFRAASNFTFDFSNQTFKDYIYAFKYDQQNHVVEVKTPGQTDWRWIVYNKIGLAVMISDPKQHTSGSVEWVVVKYDDLGRKVFTSLATTTGSRDYWQSQANSQSVIAESRTSATGNIMGYSNIAFPVFTYGGSNVVLSVQYYDDYDWDKAGHDFISSTAYPHASNILQGTLTGSKVNILGTSQYLTNIIYYDDQGRVIQGHCQNQLSGWDVVDNEYNFLNQLTKSIRTHNTSSTSMLITQRLNYDDNGRLLDLFEKVDNEEEITIAHFTYNALGQLIKKSLHNIASVNNSFLQNIDYRYNIRGWLTNINTADLLADGQINTDNDDVFGEEMYYNEIGTINTGFDFVPQYNGNIAAIRFKTSAPELGMSNTDPINAYTFRYDDMNRLTAGYYASADYLNPTEHNQELNKYTEKQSFDMMGNVMHIDRYNGLSKIDDLTFTYGSGGNKLTNVSDAATDHLPQDFLDVSGNGIEFLYDANGNSLYDYNKDLQTSYNFLNLPVQVQHSASGTSGNIQYTYDASGRKLSKTIDGVVTQYVSGIEYENGAITSIATNEGRIRPKRPQSSVLFPRYWVYDYYIKDHLGSVRAIISEETTDTRYVATMEPQNAPVEDSVFMNIPITRENREAGVPEDSTFTPNYYISYVEGVNRPVGHAKVLKVSEGEAINISTESFFRDSSTTLSSDPVTDILTNLAYIFVINNPDNSNLKPEEIGSLADQAFLDNTDVSNFVSSVLNDQSLLGDKPKAFLVYLMMDEGFHVIQSSSGAIAARTPETLEHLSLSELTIPKDGFLYVYVNNSSTLPVFFDNLQISHSSSKLLQKMDYYPFGMLWQVPGDQTPNSDERFTGKELEKGMELFEEDFGARTYNPALERWKAVDPMAVLYSTTTMYGYCRNNPVNAVDPNGMYEMSLEMRSRIDWALDYHYSGGGPASLGSHTKGTVFDPNRPVYDPATHSYMQNGNQISFEDALAYYSQSNPGSLSVSSMTITSNYTVIENSIGSATIVDNIDGSFRTVGDVGKSDYACNVFTTQITTYVDGEMTEDIDLRSVGEEFGSYKAYGELTELILGKGMIEKGIELANKAPIKFAYRNMQEIEEFGSSSMETIEKYTKIGGRIVAVAATAMTAVKIFDDYTNGREVDNWDVADLSAGIGYIALDVFCASNPVGWVLGAYLAGRAIYHLSKEDE